MDFLFKIVLGKLKGSVGEKRTTSKYVGNILHSKSNIAMLPRAHSSFLCCTDMKLGQETKKQLDVF